MLQPTLDGGTDGDGLPPSFDIGARGADFGPWITTIPWAGKVETNMSAVLNYLEGKGVSKIGMIGFCWGGWAVFHTAAMSSKIVCGAIPHPSCQLEGMFGGDVMELAKQVKVPMLMLPAGDDPKFYLPDGDLIKILQANNSQTVSTPFPEMSHGWVSRGDMSDAGTAEQVKSAVGLMQGWFAQHLA